MRLLPTHFHVELFLFVLYKIRKIIDIGLSYSSAVTEGVSLSLSLEGMKDPKEKDRWIRRLEIYQN